MVIIAPNYFTFWEGHDRIFWAPIFNWWPLGRAYVRLNGDYEILGTGEDTWKRRLLLEECQAETREIDTRKVEI